MGSASKMNVIIYIQGWERGGGEEDEELEEKEGNWQQRGLLSLHVEEDEEDENRTGGHMESTGGLEAGGAGRAGGAEGGSKEQETK